MANCFVGDIQGCYDDLRRLLDLAEFDFDNDTLWLCGDLVARGRTPSTPCVSSNHWGSRPSPCSATTTCTCWRCPRVALLKKKDKLQALMEAPDRDELLEWLRHRPLLAEHPDLPIMMVHAGLSPPGTPTPPAVVPGGGSLLRGDQYSWLLHNMYGDQPDSWNDNLLGIERYRYIINSFTRMRFATSTGASTSNARRVPPSRPRPAPLVRAARAPCG